MGKKNSPWGGGLSHKVKLYKPKNISEANTNRALALEALDKALCLSLTYDGLLRIVEVHTVGTTTAFRQAMSVWQVDGQSNTPPIPDWRLFCFDQCFNVSLLDIPSTAPRPKYKKGAKQFRSIDREV